MTMNVPQNSAGSVDTPEVMPIVSRIGRSTAYAENMQKTHAAESSAPASSSGRALIAEASQRGWPGEGPAVVSVSGVDIGEPPEVERLSRSRHLRRDTARRECVAQRGCGAG